MHKKVEINKIGQVVMKQCKYGNILFCKGCSQVDKLLFSFVTGSQKLIIYFLKTKTKFEMSKEIETTACSRNFAEACYYDITFPHR